MHSRLVPKYQQVGPGCTILALHISTNSSVGSSPLNHRWCLHTGEPSQFMPPAQLHHPIVTARSNGARHRVMEEAKDPQRAQMYAHANYTVRVAKAKTLPPAVERTTNTFQLHAQQPPYIVHCCTLNTKRNETNFSSCSRTHLTLKRIGQRRLHPSLCY